MVRYDRQIHVSNLVWDHWPHKTNTVEKGIWRRHVNQMSKVAETLMQETKKKALRTGFSNSLEKPTVGLIDHTNLSEFPAISASPLKVWLNRNKLLYRHRPLNNDYSMISFAHSMTKRLIAERCDWVSFICVKTWEHFHNNACWLYLKMVFNQLNNEIFLRKTTYNC